MGKRISKHRNGQSRKGQNDAIVARTKRMAKLVTIKGWDSEEEKTGFYGRFSFHPSIPKHRWVAVHDYICQTPNRWKIIAFCRVKYADGTRETFEAIGTTGQPSTAEGTREVRHYLMEQASGSVNPKYIEAQAYEMRIIS